MTKTGLFNVEVLHDGRWIVNANRVQRKTAERLAINLTRFHHEHRIVPSTESKAEYDARMLRNYKAGTTC